jgi:mannose-6-phosphate isomerase-like protein (cupin superfamily)
VGGGIDGLDVGGADPAIANDSNVVGLHGARRETAAALAAGLRTPHLIQPPTIRHRVLESGDNLEVIEIGYPAEHLTNADATTSLPNARVDPGRVWEGQSFIRHIATEAKWQQLASGVASTDTGIFNATQGLTDVQVIKADNKSTWQQTTIQPLTFEFLFVLDGDALVSTSHEGEHSLANGSSLVIPPGNSYKVEHINDSQILKLSLHAVK